MLVDELRIKYTKPMLVCLFFCHVLKTEQTYGRI